MKVLEDANIRHQLSLGNHDTDATGVGGSAVPGEDTSKTVRDIRFNTTFPVQRFPGMVTYEPNKIDNAYQTLKLKD